jgi:hypothetical protein
MSGYKYWQIVLSTKAWRAIDAATGIDPLHAFGRGAVLGALIAALVTLAVSWLM